MCVFIEKINLYITLKKKQSKTIRLFKEESHLKSNSIHVAYHTIRKHTISYHFVFFRNTSYHDIGISYHSIRIPYHTISLKCKRLLWILKTDFGMMTKVLTLVQLTIKQFFLICSKSKKNIVYNSVMIRIRKGFQHTLSVVQVNSIWRSFRWENTNRSSVFTAGVLR